MKKFLFRLGGILLPLGAVMPLFAPEVASFVFTAGALLFCPLQINDAYEGSNLVIRRLRRQQVLGAMLLLVTAGLMLTHLLGNFNIAEPFHGDPLLLFEIFDR